LKITITPTEKLISVSDLERQEFPRMVRAWEGITDSGAKCTILVAGVAVHEKEEQEQFQRELREFVPRDHRVFELKHIL
jgi:hypothetical protein